MGSGSALQGLREGPRAEDIWLPGMESKGEAVL